MIPPPATADRATWTAEQVSCHDLHVAAVTGAHRARCTLLHAFSLSAGEEDLEAAARGFITLDCEPQSAFLSFMLLGMALVYVSVEQWKWLVREYGAESEAVRILLDKDGMVERFKGFRNVVFHSVPLADARFGAMLEEATREENTEWARVFMEAVSTYYRRFFQDWHGIDAL